MTTRLDLGRVRPTRLTLVLVLGLAIVLGPFGLVRRAEAHSSINETYYSAASTSVSPQQARTGQTVTQTISYTQKFDGTTTVYGYDDTTSTQLWCAPGGPATAGEAKSVTGTFIAPAGDGARTIHGYVLEGDTCTSTIRAVVHTSLIIDNSPVPLAITSVTDPINGASVSSVAASGAADPGTEVTLTLSDGSGSVLGSDTAGPDATWSVSGLDATGLADGAVTYTATAGEASDEAGALKDTAAPDAPAIDTPAEGSTETTSLVTVSGTSEAASDVTIREGGSDIGAATADGTGAWSALVAFADGSHAISAVATDGAGNTGAEGAARIFSVDTADHVAPDTAIVSGPAAVTNAATATFEFTSSEAGSTFACSLDGDTASACTTPQSYAGLADGPHTFSVAATDGAGNADLSPATAAWTLDTVTPDTTITSGTSGREPTNTASFSFTTNEGGATFECKLDQEAFAACASPKGYTDLAEGPHTFEVRAVDAAGNADATPATRSFTTDAEQVERLIETLIVQVSGAPALTAAVLDSGQPYRLKVEGRYQYRMPGSPNASADAECVTAPFVGGFSWAPQRYGTNGADWNDLKVNGAFVSWRPASGTADPAQLACSTMHQYELELTGTGQKGSFSVFDPDGQQNAGLLLVRVYALD